MADHLGNGDKSENPAQSGSQKHLTGIREAYTLSATQEHDSEADRLMVKNFIDTLAEVAMTIASRKVTK